MISVDDIIVKLKRDSIWDEHRIVMDPLVGTFDGVNVVFRTSYSPIDPDDVILYDDTYAVIASGYSVNDDREGVILFSVAPSSIVYATFSVVRMATSKLQDFVLSGLDEMESRLPRGYVFYNDGGTLVLSSSSTSAVDPIVENGNAFSEDGQQVGLLVLCIKYRIALAMYQQASANVTSFREERSGGLMIDTTKNPSSWRELVDMYNTQIESARFDISDTYGDIVGGYHYENEDGTVWVLDDSPITW